MPKKIELMERGRKKRQTHPVYVIVCEGKKTEPIYFDNFRQRNRPIQIEILTGAAGKSYEAIIKEATAAKKKYITGLENGGELWCVSDVDGVTTLQLDKYKKDAKAIGAKIALSNPCFELWYYLHFAYTTATIKNYGELVKKLPKVLQPYAKEENIYHKLKDSENTAITNAKKLEAHHKAEGRQDCLDIQVLPYTSVYKLVEKLRR